MQKHAASKVNDFYVGACPFHPDDGKTMSVDLRAKTYACFTCGKKGTAKELLDILHEMNTKSLRDEIEIQVRKELGQKEPKLAIVADKVKRVKKRS